MDIGKVFGRFSGAIAHATGTPAAFALCLLVVVAWAVTGPAFHYSDTWQLVINTGTTIVTFLMVFLIQNTQNRDGAAIQIKLDELILTSKAENDFIGIEKLSDQELETLRRRCVAEAEKNQKILERTTAVIHARKSGKPGERAKPSGAASKPKPKPRRAPAKPRAAKDKPS
jgi:low affinity Fe/Cu permease